MRTPLPIAGPLGLGDLLDGAFRLYRARFGRLLLTAAIFQVPVGIVSTLLVGTALGGLFDLVGAMAGEQLPEPAAGELLGLIGAFGIVSLLGYAAAVLAYVTLTGQVLALLAGENLSLREGIRRVLGRVLPFVGMALLLALAIGAIVAGTYLVAMIALLAVTLLMGGLLAAVGDNSIMAAGFVLMALLIYFVLLVLAVLPVGYLVARWIAAPTVVVSEQLGPRRALGRSWQLTRRHTWRCFGYIVLLAILNFVILGLPVTVLQWFALIIATPQWMGWLTGIITGIGYLMNVVWYPFLVLALVLIYYDLRVRTESYDLELRIRQLEESMRPASLPQS